MKARFPNRQRRDPLPQRAAAAFDRFTGAAAPHALLLILALIAIAILERI